MGKSMRKDCVLEICSVTKILSTLQYKLVQIAFSLNNFARTFVVQIALLILNFA